MTRRDYIWVGIRLFGVGLAILALLAFLQFSSEFSNFWVYTTLSDQAVESMNFTRDDLRMMYGANAGAQIFKAIVLSIAAYYSLRRGEGLVRWVVGEKSEIDAV